MYVTSDIGRGTYNILTGPYGVTFDVRSLYDIIKVSGICIVCLSFYESCANRTIHHGVRQVLPSRLWALNLKIRKMNLS